MESTVCRCATMGRESAAQASQAGDLLVEVTLTSEDPLANCAAENNEAASPAAGGG